MSNKIKEMGLCDEYEVYSNDVKFGEEPIFIEKTRNNTGRTSETTRDWEKGMAKVDGRGGPGFTGEKENARSGETISSTDSGYIKIDDIDSKMGRA